MDVPVYDYGSHQPLGSRRVHPSDVVIVEGTLVLHFRAIRDLLSMKVFVDTDDDVRLARRYAERPGCCALILESHEIYGIMTNWFIGAVIVGGKAETISARLSRHGSWAFTAGLNIEGLCRISRDVTERGRNVAVVIEQYTSQVKPAFERFVRPSRKHADVIIPWSRRVLSNQGVIHSAVHPG